MTAVEPADLTRSTTKTGRQHAPKAGSRRALRTSYQ